MLTGDTKRVAEQVAKDLGVDEVHSELLPADKVTQVEKLLAEKSPKKPKKNIFWRHYAKPEITRAKRHNY